MTYPDPAAGQRLIQSGRADIMMTDLVLVDQLVRDNPSVYARAYTILSGFKIGVGVHKGDKNLEQAISDTLRMLDANGTTKQIYARYGLDPALALPIEILTQ
jgi:polar amino acid transport system substrate-binding protein